jgi:hypothetical protein
MSEVHGWRCSNMSPNTIPSSLPTRTTPLTPHPYIANTDQKWFDFLSSVVAPRGGRSGVVEEANFWFPNTTAPRLKAISAGTPVFLRLKSPERAIAGVGFFAAYHMLPLDEAWLAFGEGNGDPSQHRFESRIRAYRTGRSFDVSLRETDRSSLAAPLACMILRAVEFWPRERWIPWAEAEGFKPQIVSGKYEEDPARIARLTNAIGEARARGRHRSVSGFSTPMATSVPSPASTRRPSSTRRTFTRIAGLRAIICRTGSSSRRSSMRSSIGDM